MYHCKYLEQKKQPLFNNLLTLFFNTRTKYTKFLLTQKRDPEIRISSVPLELVLRNDFFFVVRATVLAYSVRHHQLSTLAAFY